MTDDEVFAHRLADLAAAISVPRFRSGRYSITTKPDGSPVTDVDVAIEVALRRRIASDRPNHEVVGEELGHSGSSAWRWYLEHLART